MASFETQHRFKAHGTYSDLLIVDSVCSENGLWDPTIRHEPWLKEIDIKRGAEPLKILSARLIAHHCTELTSRMLCQGNWAAWGIVWEQICEYGYDSFDILTLFANHFRTEKSFTCMGERITDMAKSVKGKCNANQYGKWHHPRQRLVFNRLASRRHRIELLRDNHTLNIKVVRQFQQHLAPFMITTLDLTGVDIGVNEQEKRQTLVELCDLECLSALRLSQLDNYTARIWNLSLRYGDKWPKLELLSILSPARNYLNLEWIDTLLDRYEKRNLTLEIPLISVENLKKSYKHFSGSYSIQAYHKAPLVSTLKRVRRSTAKKSLSLKNSIVVDFFKFYDTSQITAIGTWLLFKSKRACPNSQLQRDDHTTCEKYW